MVLVTAAGGAAPAGTPRGRSPARRLVVPRVLAGRLLAGRLVADRPVADRLLGSQDGSQAVEFALVVPGVFLVLLLLLHAGLLGVELVAVQGVAREAARVAAVADDSAVREAAARVAPRRQLRVELAPPAGRRRAGELVTATVRLRSRVLRLGGTAVWLPARATMQVEDG